MAVNQAVQWSTKVKLPCAGPSSCCGCSSSLSADVILCVGSSLTESGLSFIEAVLTKEIITKLTCDIVYKYTFEYDDAQLADPETPLVASQISGVFCVDCMTTWITESIFNLNAPIYYGSAFGIFANTEDGADSIALKLSGGGAFDPIRGAGIQLIGNEAGGGLTAFGGAIATGDLNFFIRHASAIFAILDAASNSALTVNNDHHVAIFDAGSIPAAGAGRGKLYVQGGELRYIGSAGTITVLAPP